MFQISHLILRLRIGRKFPYTNETEIQDRILFWSSNSKYLQKKSKKG